jgi:hypothetical protein
MNDKRRAKLHDARRMLRHALDAVASAEDAIRQLESVVNR